MDESNNYDGYDPARDIYNQYKEEGVFETLFRVCPHWWVLLIAVAAGFAVAWGIERVLF